MVVNREPSVVSRAFILDYKAGLTVIRNFGL